MGTVLIDLFWEIKSLRTDPVDFPNEQMNDKKFLKLLKGVNENRPR